MYNYTIKEITKIYDGDTITVIIDLGFSVTTKQILRLANINTPEIRGVERPEGLISRDYLRDRLNRAVASGQVITAVTIKDKTGKYGRYIAEIFVDGVSINDELVTEGFAEYKEY